MLLSRALRVSLLFAVFALGCSDESRSPVAPPPEETASEDSGARDLVVQVERPIHGPEVGARVMLDGQDVVLESRTDSRGEARFSEIVDGMYFLRIDPVDEPSFVRRIDVGPPFPVRIEIVLDSLDGVGRAGLAWDGATRLWGEAVDLRVESVPAAIDSVIWRSLNDFYHGGPVILGRGSELRTSALKPGTTTVQARLYRADRLMAMGAANVDVVYRSSWNVALEGRALEGQGAADVWVDGEFAYVSRGDGISIVRIAGTIDEVGRFTERDLFNRDVKVADGIAYLSNESDSGEAVVVVDVGDPVRPARLAAIAGSRVHNLYVDGERLYTASPGVGFHGYDVSDPTRPSIVGSFERMHIDAHDVHARDGLVFGAVIDAHGEAADVVVALDPGLVAVGSAVFESGDTHTAWLSEDGRHLYVTDERTNAPIRILDVTNPADPRLVSTYQPRLGAVPHNFQVRDDRLAFLSHYVHGVEVVDVSDPVAPRLVGFFDTRPGPEGGGFQGAWGVHWDERGRFVASDRTEGLFVLRYVGPGGP